MIVHMGSRGVHWVQDEGTGDLNGVGEHATYVVHQSTVRKTGEPEVKGKFYTYRRLGQNPLKAVGGPYETEREAKMRADIMEASI